MEIAGVEMVYATDDAMKCVLSATNLQNTEFVRTGITSDGKLHHVEDSGWCNRREKACCKSI